MKTATPLEFFECIYYSVYVNKNTEVCDNSTRAWHL